MIKGNPQWPQAFYPTTREFSVAKGDEILIRCTYSSLGKDTYTRSGTRETRAKFRKTAFSFLND